MKKLKKLGNVLTSKDLKKINGGALCDTGFACMCSFHFVGCFTSMGACEHQCESSFPDGHGGVPLIIL
ncbi:hypothetical protein [uncultured Dokdonia sp.]|uniref:hypothetical protein n=1 Tax=uncultured Dokdonia sp. TaxID=575653 RepID=UPI002634E3B2|nr:hypothetical protein [uncultured Dokdonia sp.]